MLDIKATKIQSYVNKRDIVKFKIGEYTIQAELGSNSKFDVFGRGPRKGQLKPGYYQLITKSVK